MSTWIYITNLPLYYDEYGLLDIFNDIGQIVATAVTKNEIILKSTGFVQFASPKHAKLAASKKDQTVIANSAVRVYLIWNEKEDLSTIRVENILPNSNESDLEKTFDPYGEIVDITIINTNVALISFCRVDYALQAVQEMNHTIIGMGKPLSVSLSNPDARNLKWKRNSFQYKRLQIPPITYNKPHHHRKHHKNHHHRHQHHQHQQQQQQLTNNDNGLLHPSYIHNRNRNKNREHSHRQRNNNNKSGRNNRSNRHNNQQYDDDINNYHHRHDRYNERHHHKQRKPRKYRSARSITSQQSTLLGPLHNESGGQYRTYNVTPSPTRSMGSQSQSHSHSEHSNKLNVHHNQIQLQRMNSGDSTSSNCSVQSLPNYYQNAQTQNSKRVRGALETYGFQQMQTHHSPLPYNVVQTPVSPASTGGLSTPSTTHSTHSMATPPTYHTHNNQNNLRRSKTPTPFLHNVRTPTKSATTPISAASVQTPPLPSYTMLTSVTPQNYLNNMNIINNMNALTMNVNNVNGLLSPTSLILPNLDILQTQMNKSQTSPIVITPSTNLLLQHQMRNKAMAQSLSLSPPNTQQNFVYNCSTLQGPFNTPPQPQKRFVFNDKHSKKSPSPSHSSHSWTQKEEQLGNKLYEMIKTKYPQRATKIVGMLLTANKTEDIEFMLGRPHILMALANDYDQQQRSKELNKHK